MAVFSSDNEKDRVDLDYLIRWEMVYLAYSQLGPSWNGVQEPMARTSRLFHMARSGGAYLLVNGKRFDMEPGHIYHIPADLTTERICDSYYENYFGYFHCRSLGGQNLLSGYPYPLDIGTWDIDALGKGAEKLDSVATQIYVKYVVLAGLIRHYPGLAETLNKTKSTGPRFHSCLRFIDDNLSANLEVRQLAEFVGMSRNAFTRAFKNATGATPMGYLNNELNEKACRLVLNSNLSIREIGNRLGFRDEYYFNRFFKKMNGTPPLRYRKAHA